jgi:pimeloyl-ACP methyl ester carboxylesterase
MLRRHLLPLVLAAATAGGCVGLRSHAEVLREVPAERFVKVGGQLVHVEQAGQGQPVVFVHGFGASTYMWRQVQPTVARSFRTLAVDLSGFGWTERPRRREAYSREGQVALLRGVLDALGIDRAHFVGHSYGGALSLWLAAEHPERVRSLVLVDSAAPTYPDDRRSPAAAFRPLATAVARLRLREANVRRALEASVHDDSLVTPELVAAYAERVRVEGVGRAFWALTAPAPRAPEFDWGRIRVPVLAIWGEHDTLVTAADGRSVVERLPRGEFVLLPGVGHMPPEEDPKAVVAALVPFLEQVSGEGAP